MSDAGPYVFLEGWGSQSKYEQHFPLNLLCSYLCSSWHPASWSSRSSHPHPNYKQYKNVLEENPLQKKKNWSFCMTIASPVAIFVSSMFQFMKVGHYYNCFLFSYQNLYACTYDWGVLYIPLFFLYDSLQYERVFYQECLKKFWRLDSWWSSQWRLTSKTEPCHECLMHVSWD